MFRAPLVLVALCSAASAAPEEVAYGSHQLQTVDVYRGSRSAAVTVLWIHGGGWMYGDKRQDTASQQYLRETILAAGYDFVAANYRLAPADPYPAAEQDVEAALVWLQAGAAARGLGKTIVVMGESAGATLGAKLALAHRPAVAGFVGVNGPMRLDDEPEDSLVGRRARVYLGDCLKDCPERARKASPWWVEPSKDAPPLLVVTATADKLVPPRHAEIMRERHGARIVTLAGAQHTGPTMMRRDLADAVLEFLREVAQ